MYHITKDVYGNKYWLQFDGEYGTYVWNGLINNAHLFSYFEMNRVIDRYSGNKSVKWERL